MFLPIPDIEMLKIAWSFKQWERALIDDDVIDDDVMDLDASDRLTDTSELSEDTPVDVF